VNTNKLPQAGTEETSVDRQRVSGQLEQWVKTAGGSLAVGYENVSTTS